MVKTIVCTPTKNRGWTYKFSKACMDAQVQSPVHWVVVDNSDTPEQGWGVSQSDPRVVYEHVDGPRTVGWMRNRCIEIALRYEWDFLVFWDDDDYYPPTRISTGVNALVSSPKADIAGSTVLWILLTRENVMVQSGPFHDAHATAATFTVRRSYVESNRFDPEKKKGEELSFTKNWAASMVQVPHEETIVVMGHSTNTVDKSDVGKRPHVYGGHTINSDNARMMFRVRWPVPWELFRETFRV